MLVKAGADNDKENPLIDSSSATKGGTQNDGEKKALRNDAFRNPGLLIKVFRYYLSPEYLFSKSYLLEAVMATASASAALSSDFNSVFKIRLTIF